MGHDFGQSGRCRIAASVLELLLPAAAAAVGLWLWCGMGKWDVEVAFDELEVGSEGAEEGVD